MTLILVSYLALLQLDPFGIQTASIERSEQAVLRISAPFYRNSNQVVVVLIDDAYLDGVKRSWPLPYADQGRLLRTIFQHAPAVVYLDILYGRKHKTASIDQDAANADDPLDLVKPISLKQESPESPPTFAFPETRLIFTAQIRPGLQDQLLPSLCAAGGLEATTVVFKEPGSVLPELNKWIEKNNQRVDVALVGWWGCGDRYPLTLPGASNDETPTTPARAMLAAWCKAKERPETGCRTLYPGNTWLDKPFAPMMVRWGAAPPTAQRPFYPAGECQADAGLVSDGGWLLKLWQSFSQLVLGLFEDLRDSPHPNLALPCPAVTILPASVVHFGDQEQVDNALRDKIVLVGAKVTGISDWHQSPVHGQVPGVVLHGMAIDNLLTLGNRYASDPDARVLWGLTFGSLVLLAFLVPVLMVVRKSLPTPSGQGAKFSPLASMGVWVVIIVLLGKMGGQGSAVVAAIAVGIATDFLKPTQTIGYALLVLVLALVGAVLLGLFGWAPVNWIGLFLVVVAFAATAAAFYDQTNPKPFPDPESFLSPSVSPYLQKLDRFEGRRAMEWAIQWTEGLLNRYRRSRTSDAHPPPDGGQR